MMVAMRQLLPDPIAELTVQDAYVGTLGTRTDRPWVTLSMITSIDGSTVVDGNSGRLSSPTDSAVLVRLRRIADVIIVGAGTVRQEGYGRPSKRGQRVGVLTQSGSVDLLSELFTTSSGFLITTADSRFETGNVDVIRAGHDRVDLADAIRQIPDLCPGSQVVQAEGGAALNGSLLEADVLDEINVTTSPTTVGGTGPRLTSGATDYQNRFDLAQLSIDEDSFLYARWLRSRARS
jgi:riboflavin biosynthesis pyrimidine reductase